MTYRQLIIYPFLPLTAIRKITLQRSLRSMRLARRWTVALILPCASTDHVYYCKTHLQCVFAPCSDFAVAANASSFPTFNVTVNDTAPIWVYVCRNPIVQVFVINLYLDLSVARQTRLIIVVLAWSSL